MIIRLLLQSQRYVWQKVQGRLSGLLIESKKKKKKDSREGGVIEWFKEGEGEC